jgi:hypothetical protein
VLTHTFLKPSTLALILRRFVSTLYYNPFISSRAATILHHNKQAVEVMWGRLLTCGRLAIGQLPVTSDTVCGLPLCGAGCQPWLSACRRQFARSQPDRCPLRLAAMRGVLLGAPSGSGRFGGAPSPRPQTRAIEIQEIRLAET